MWNIVFFFSMSIARSLPHARRHTVSPAQSNTHFRSYMACSVCLFDCCRPLWLIKSWCALNKDLATIVAFISHVEYRLLCAKGPWTWMLIARRHNTTSQANIFDHTGPIAKVDDIPSPQCKSIHTFVHTGLLCTYAIFYVSYSSKIPLWWIEITCGSKNPASTLRHTVSPVHIKILSSIHV